MYANNKSELKWPGATVDAFLSVDHIVRGPKTKDEES